MTTFLSYLYLPESPRWLVSEGRWAEAGVVLAGVCIKNGVTPMPLSTPDGKAADVEGSRVHGGVRVGSLVGLTPPKTGSKAGSISTLFTPKYKTTTMLLWGMWGAFGLCYFSTVELISLLYSTDTDGDDGTVTSCSFDYSFLVLVSSSELVSIFLTSHVIEQVTPLPVSQLYP